VVQRGGGITRRRGDGSIGRVILLDERDTVLPNREPRRVGFGSESVNGRPNVKGIGRCTNLRNSAQGVLVQS